MEWLYGPQELLQGTIKNSNMAYFFITVFPVQMYVYIKEWNFITVGTIGLCAICCANVLTYSWSMLDLSGIMGRCNTLVGVSKWLYSLLIAVVVNFHW